MDIFAIETEMHRRHIYGLLDSLNNSIFAYDELNKKAVDILTKLKSGEITIDDIDVSPQGFDIIPPAPLASRLSDASANGSGELGVQLLPKQGTDAVEAGG